MIERPKLKEHKYVQSLEQLAVLWKMMKIPVLCSWLPASLSRTLSSSMEIVHTTCRGPGQRFRRAFWLPRRAMDGAISRSIPVSFTSCQRMFVRLAAAAESICDAENLEVGDGTLTPYRSSECMLPEH